MTDLRREIAVATAIGVLALVLAVFAPGYFSAENLGDLFLANVPILVVAIGATLVILTGEIDISVGSVFAVCGVVSGIASKLAAAAGLPASAVSALLACGAGVALGAMNGALVAYAQIPSIVVTLATMVAWREGLRWAMQGRWVENLPPDFQWLGLTTRLFPIVVGVAVSGLLLAVAWAMRNIACGRAIYATGSNPAAARLAGIDVRLAKFAVLACSGGLTGLAALLNAVRFNQIPSNAGVGLEMKVIAAAVVGGASITGGRATFTGTLLGVVLLGAVGPALTFLGVSAYWERALQGAIVVIAVALDAAGRRRIARGRRASLPPQRAEKRASGTPLGHA